jgi:hypothetical protein
MPPFFRFPLFALLLALPLALTACGDDAMEDAEGVTQATPPSPDVSDTEADESARPRLEDGVQVVEIEAGRMGYQPREVALAADVPTRLIFTRTVESECSSQVQIPAFGVPVTDLPLGEPVAVEFTPTESGAFTFVCGMDMQTGSIMVRS